MEDFASWLLSAVSGWFISIGNVFIDIANAFIDMCCTFAITFITETLPTMLTCGSFDMPTLPPAGPIWTQLVHVLNWLFPLATLLSVVICTMAFVSLYFTVAPVLRWFKILT